MLVSVREQIYLLYFQGLDKHSRNVTPYDYHVIHKSQASIKFNNDSDRDNVDDNITSNFRVIHIHGGIIPNRDSRSSSCWAIDWESWVCNSIMHPLALF